MAIQQQALITELKPGIFQILGDKPGSHVYLLKGSNKYVLVDTGTAFNFPLLKQHLKELGVRLHDINVVILSHEHFDHIGASTYFCKTAVVCAHRLAANKIELQDEFVTMNMYFDRCGKLLNVHLWLEDRMLIDLGNYKLHVVHTPGHTSGCICLYEAEHKLLFSGDTVFAKGTLSQITTSGNISDYVSSLRYLSSLRIVELYPAHEGISSTPEEDMNKAVDYAENLMEDSKVWDCNKVM